MTLTIATERVQYSKVENGTLCFVIVDRQADGRTEFWAQEAGEVRWYRFTPVPPEEMAAIALFGRTGGADWPLLRYAAAACATQ